MNIDFWSDMKPPRLNRAEEVVSIISIILPIVHRIILRISTIFIYAECGERIREKEANIIDRLLGEKLPYTKNR